MGETGFTLIELMVTVAVVGILAMVAVPAMTSLVNGNRLAGMTGEVTSSLQLARSEAIRRNARVTICGSTDGTTCGGGGDWSRWIVTGRDNTTGVVEVIRDNAAPGSVQISGPAGGIEFRPSGLIDGEEQLTVCVPTDSPEQNQRVITVMISGNLFTNRNNGGGACP
ncbi:GspH/FimT family pseudopilin [Luteimonas aestuarii]|nr:GspH/FimT family pseudopilin [Luteimonas aestuarii]